MEENKFYSLSKLLNEPKKIVIVPHINPDGDAMGSTLGLRSFLSAMGHLPVVISPNDYPEFLKWLPGNEQVIIFDQDPDRAENIIKRADLIFTLDFNSLSRAGTKMAEILGESQADFVLIDHHQQPEDYAEYIYSDVNSSSTSELVYDFINRLNKTHLITDRIATCLYAGIMTDTGSFRYPSTSSNTHRVIADLIDKGANNALIHQNIFDTRTPDQLRLLGVALKNLKVLSSLNTAYITLTQKELDDHNFKKGDTEGFVNYGLSLKGIIFAVIFIENKEEELIKISFRSKGEFDVNQFARNHFNGGGHKNAAGGRCQQSMEETVAFFEKTIKEYAGQLNQVL